VAGIASSGWTALVSLTVVPFYLHFLGLQAFGLIGLFTTLQGLFIILDLGLSPTMTRETARCRVSGETGEARNLLHSLACIYWAIAAGIAAIMVVAGLLFGSLWVHETDLSAATVNQAVALIGLVIACRWPLSIYIGALQGAERIAEVSLIAMAMVTFSNVGAVLVLAFVSPTIQAFFIWQAFGGLLQVVVMRARAWRALSGDMPVRFDRQKLMTIWRFTAGIGATALFGIIFYNADKVLLSGLVPLAEFGLYALAGLAARTLYILITPISNALSPRMTALYAAGDEAGLSLIYRQGTRLLMALTAPLGAFIAVFAAPLMGLWTGNARTGEAIAPALQLLLLGTALNGATFLLYGLQIAAGRSRLSAMIHLILLVGFIPTVVILTTRYGIIGGAACWAIFNVVLLCLGATLTHRVILRGLALRWIFLDVLFPLATALVLVVGGGLAIRAAGWNLWLSLAAGLIPLLIAIAAIAVTLPHVSALVRQLLRLRVAGRPEANETL
jgi:O-antigen/teichoic acid export membrane protein